jgi:hypothetical protein
MCEELDTNDRNRISFQNEVVKKRKKERKKKTMAKIQNDTPSYGYNLQLKWPFYMESYNAERSLNYTG